MADTAKRRNARLDDQKIIAVQKLLDHGLSHRKIASLVGVSRGSIGRISRGLCCIRSQFDEKNPLPLIGSGPPRRCPNCGAKVIDGTTSGDCFGCQIAKYARDVRRKVISGQW